MRSLTFAQAIQEATDQCMVEDDTVIICGEGVPDGIFGTTAGLKDKYPTRVFDSPLSENAATGICIGAALNGLKPIQVHQRIDFTLLAADQIINNAAKWFYTFGQPVPMVIRCVVGRGWGQGSTHSQTLQWMFSKIPGLKVVSPASPYEAKGMMVAAIRDKNPVIFVENRWLHHIKDTVPEELYETQLTGARLVRSGKDITVVGFGYMVVEALEVAKVLFDYGIEVAVIDMRCSSELDIGTIGESVCGTGKLLVLDSDGMGDAIISKFTQRFIGRLYRRTALLEQQHYPQPTSHFLTKDYYPTAASIAETVLNMTDYPELIDTVVPLLTRKEHDKPNTAFTGPF